ncbi:MAG: NAD(P)-dependent glycerol-3-phosphate dehydrogenase [bacterium]|nr:NAD(P)-dependent glycerol-3-phosphate dehydrogenase [bacterium]
MIKTKKITILGLGSWGYALTMVLHDKGHLINVWEYDKERLKRLEKDRKFDLIQGTEIPENIFLTNDIQEACLGSDLVVFAVPSHGIRSVAKLLKDKNIKPKRILSVAKGLEYETLFSMTEVVADELGYPNADIYALSGPTHAEEVSRKIFTTVVIAGEDELVLKELQEVFAIDYFRVYISQDLRGVELGGAIKNVIAIATGIADGLNLGDNTKAAIITRGLAEISRLGKLSGAKPETFYGLSGLGDLAVTCISQHSRNRYFGEQLGRGRKYQDILNEMKMVAEGVSAAKSIYKLAGEYNVEMPIVREVYNIVYYNKDPKVAVVDLMGRSLKEEES